MNGPDRLSYRDFACRITVHTGCGGGAGDPNRSLLASMIAGQAPAQVACRLILGWAHVRYDADAGRLFPGNRCQHHAVRSIPELDRSAKAAARPSRRRTRFRTAGSPTSSRPPVPARDHLWQDLGLANRDELTRLMWVKLPGTRPGQYRRHEVEEISLPPDSARAKASTSAPPRPAAIARTTPNVLDRRTDPPCRAGAPTRRAGQRAPTSTAASPPTLAWPSAMRWAPPSSF